ncbi:MAG TPA: hypothetical protein VFC19_06785, partial [Candidatus Limnocylindrales bacterium]|nr:hypothetical protein [Candidatus Limnocylindrales bacterium]
IVFASAASNLVAGDTNDNQDVFLFDQRTRHLSLISRASNGTQGNSHTEQLGQGLRGAFLG